MERNGNTFIAVDGHIGVGKTTLIENVVKLTKWIPVYEPVIENPFLSAQYSAIEASDLNSMGPVSTQIFFAIQRYNKQLTAMQNTTNQVIVFDRILQADANVFCDNLNTKGYINSDYFSLYNYFINGLIHFLPKIDYYFYLSATIDTVWQRIQNRGRDYEQNLSKEYLELIQSAYEAMIQKLEATQINIVRIAYDKLTPREGAQEIINFMKQKISV